MTNTVSEVVEQMRKDVIAFRAAGHGQWADCTEHWADRLSASRECGEVIRPLDDELWDQTLHERDSAQEMADDLAAQIAAITGVDIGEHSNLNDPWREAMLAADDYIAKQIRSLCRVPERPQSPPAATVDEAMVVSALMAWQPARDWRASPMSGYEKAAMHAALTAALAKPKDKS